MSDPKQSINFNINDLTIAEIVEIEDLTGLPFDAVTDPSKPKGGCFKLCVYQQEEREPEFTSKWLERFL